MYEWVIGRDVNAGTECKSAELLESVVKILFRAYSNSCNDIY